MWIWCICVWTDKCQYTLYVMCCSHSYIILISGALRGIIMLSTKVQLFKCSIPGKEMHFHAGTYWKPSVLEGEGILKSVPCSIDIVFSSRTQCITCLQTHGCSRKTICQYTYAGIYFFKYKHVAPAQVCAVAFTIHFPNERTNNIKQSWGSWGCCKFGPGMPWPFQSAGVWWLWILCLVSPKDGDAMVIRYDPVLGVNSRTWWLYLCRLLQPQVRSHG